MATIEQPKDTTLNSKYCSGGKRGLEEHFITFYTGLWSFFGHQVLGALRPRAP